MLCHAQRSSVRGDGDRLLNSRSRNAKHLEFYSQYFGDLVALQSGVD